MICFSLVYTVTVLSPIDLLAVGLLFSTFFTDQAVQQTFQLKGLGQTIFPLTGVSMVVDLYKV